MEKLCYEFLATFTQKVSKIQKGTNFQTVTVIVHNISPSLSPSPSPSLSPSLSLSLYLSLSFSLSPYLSLSLYLPLSLSLFAISCNVAAIGTEVFERCNESSRALMYWAKISGIQVWCMHTSCTKGMMYINMSLCLSLSLCLQFQPLCPVTGLVTWKLSRDNIDEWKLAKLMHSSPLAISNEVSSISLMSWVLYTGFIWKWIDTDQDELPEMQSFSPSETLPAAAGIPLRAPWH